MNDATPTSSPRRAKETPQSPAPPGDIRSQLLQPRYRNYVLLMATIGHGLNFLDRQIVSILLPPIKAEMQVSDSQLGLMSGLAFAVFYALFGVPLARLADRWSRRSLMGISIIIWSGMTTLAGFVQTFPQLVMVRFGVGIGEAGYSPSMFSLISDYFSKARRQTAAAIVNVGPTIGTMVGLVIGGLAAPTIGWRGAFLVAGAPGVLFGILVLLTVREPPRGLADGVIVEAAAPPPFLNSAARLLAIQSYRWLLLAGGMFAFAILGQSVWMPSLLVRAHHMPLPVLGPLLGLTLVSFGAVGTLLGGLLGDRLFRRDERLSLLLPILGGLLGGPAFAAAALAPTPALSLVLFGLGYMMISLHVGPIFALLQSTAPIRLRALAMSFLVLVNSLLGFGLGPTSIGLLSDALEPAAGEAALGQAMAIMALSSLIPAVLAALAWSKLKSDVAAADHDGDPAAAL